MDTSTIYVCMVKDYNQIPERDLNDLAEEIGSAWRTLGMQLGIQSTKLEQFRDENRKLKDVVTEILCHWNRNSKRPLQKKMELLRYAVEKCGRNDLIKRLKLFNTGTTHRPVQKSDSYPPDTAFTPVQEARYYTVPNVQPYAANPPQDPQQWQQHPPPYTAENFPPLSPTPQQPQGASQFQQTPHQPTYNYASPQQPTNQQPGPQQRQGYAQTTPPQYGQIFPQTTPPQYRQVYPQGTTPQDMQGYPQGTPPQRMTHPQQATCTPSQEANGRQVSYPSDYQSQLRGTRTVTLNPDVGRSAGTIPPASQPPPNVWSGQPQNVQQQRIHLKDEVDHHEQAHQNDRNSQPQQAHQSHQLTGQNPQQAHQQKRPVLKPKPSQKQSVTNQAPEDPVDNFRGLHIDDPSPGKSQRNDQQGTPANHNNQPLSQGTGEEGGAVGGPEAEPKGERESLKQPPPTKMSDLESAQLLEPQSILRQDRSIDAQSIQLEQILDGELDYEDKGKKNCIGAGTFGRVLPGKLKEEEVAVKVIKMPDMLEEMYQNCCEQEIKIMVKVNQLRHPNIVQFKGYKVEEDTNEILIVSELVKGKNLQDVLRKRKAGNRIHPGYLLEFRDRLKMAVELADALQGLHGMGITHRDIKPSNLLICNPSHGDPQQLKLCDLGLAKAKEGCGVASVSSRAGGLTGTLMYAAREIVIDKLSPTKASDIFSYGASMFQLFTEKPHIWPLGNNPEKTITDSLKNRKLPDHQKMGGIEDLEVRELIAACLDHNPKKRPSAQALVDGLQKVQQSLHKTMLFRLPANTKLSIPQLRFIIDKLAPCVCRIRIPGTSGTGFIIGALKLEADALILNRFILTSYHLGAKEAIESGRNCDAQFGFLESGEGAKVTVPIIPHVFAYDKTLDYIVLALQSTDQFENYLQNEVCLDLGSMIAKREPDPKDPLVIVGHPGGNELQVDSAYAEPRPVNKPSQHIFYQCSTFEGGSGAPVFSKNRQELYSIHTGGDWKVDPSIADTTNSIEHGVFLWDVLRHIKDNFVHHPGTAHQQRIPSEWFSQLFPNFTG